MTVSDPYDVDVDTVFGFGHDEWLTHRHHFKRRVLNAWMCIILDFYSGCHSKKMWIKIMILIEKT